MHRWSTGTLPIEVVAVVSNHQDMRSLAEWHGVPYHYLPIIDGRKAEQERRIIELYERADAELLVLARYMQILSSEACSYFEGRAINIHHSFLPGFKGAKPYHQAHTRGVKLIGAMARYVTTDLDEGPIIEQEVSRVDHTQSPEDMTVVGSELEAVVLNRAIKWHAERGFSATAAGQWYSSRAAHRMLRRVSHSSNSRLTRNRTVRTLLVQWPSQFEKAPRKRVVNYRSY